MSEQLNEIALGQNAWLMGVLLRWKLKSDYPELGHLGVGIWKNLKFRWQEHQWWCIPAQLRVEFCTFSCSSGCWNLKVSRAGCCLNWRRERWDSRIKYFSMFARCSAVQRTKQQLTSQMTLSQSRAGQGFLSPALSLSNPLLFLLSIVLVAPPWAPPASRISLFTVLWLTYLFVLPLSIQGQAQVCTPRQVVVI